MSDNYFKFKEDTEEVFTGELYYDLFDGGYINPEDLLKNEDDIIEVREAILTIQTFLAEAQEAGKIIID